MAPRHPAHIAFCDIPGHGHVNPSLAVVTELVNRGHRVSYAINDEFAPQVAEAGATPVLYTSTLPSDNSPDESWPEDMVAGATLFLDEAITVLPQLEAAFADDRPDVIVYDVACWPAAVLAEKWDIPIIQLSPTFVYYEGWADEVVGLEGEESVAAMTGVYARFQDFLSEHGIDTPAPDFMGLPKRCMVTLPRGFQPGADTVTDNYAFVGPCLGQRAFQGDWQAAGDRPVLLVSLGSSYTDQLEFFRTCVRAFGGLDWQVLLTIGRYVDPADLGELPANIEVHRRVPQLRVLEQASVFVTHAGMGSTVEGLYHGVPLVAVPQIGEQRMNARRIAELGLGRHLPREEVTARALRSAVLELAGDEAVRERLSRMAEECRAAGGAVAAADLVEDLLG